MDQQETAAADVILPIWLPLTDVVTHNSLTKALEKTVGKALHADVSEKNLAQYDALFLASTTGAFLDDSKDAAATAARRKALLDFVRGGKGLAGIHAATDSYHQSAPVPGAPRAGDGPAAVLAKELLAQGDQNGDGRLGREELRALADAWFDKVDPEKSGHVDRAAFAQRFTAVIPPPPPSSPPPLGPTGFPVQAPAAQLGPDTQVGTWPEFNRLIGAFFKFSTAAPANNPCVTHTQIRLTPFSASTFAAPTIDPPVLNMSSTISAVRPATGPPMMFA